MKLLPPHVYHCYGKVSWVFIIIFFVVVVVGWWVGYGEINRRWRKSNIYTPIFRCQYHRQRQWTINRSLFSVNGFLFLSCHIRFEITCERFFSRLPFQPSIYYACFSYINSAAILTYQSLVPFRLPFTCKNNSDLAHSYKFIEINFHVIQAFYFYITFDILFLYIMHKCVCVVCTAPYMCIHLYVCVGFTSFFHRMLYYCVGASVALNLLFDSCSSSIAEKFIPATCQF